MENPINADSVVGARPYVKQVLSRINGSQSQNSKKDQIGARYVRDSSIYQDEVYPREQIGGPNRKTMSELMEKRWLQP